MSTENPLQSIEWMLAFDVRDWSIGCKDAWLYGVVCGWDADAMEEIALKHGWTPETVARLNRLHARWKALMEAEEGNV